MKLLEYTAIDGIPTFTDSFILSLFDRMADEQLVSRVFYDGSVSSGQDFLQMMKFGANRLFVIGLPDKSIGGLCWLNGFDGRRADFHFCFFSNLRGDEAVEIGRQAFTEIINMEGRDGRPLFDLLTGLVEATNLPALKWCQRMGFSTLGVLPAALWNSEAQKSVPAQVWYAERGTYGKKGR